MLFAFLGSALALASTPTPPKSANLSAQLNGLRANVLGLESSLIDGLKVQKEAKANIKKIQSLIRLQRQERELSLKRLDELTTTLAELQSRRAELRQRIIFHEREVRRMLALLGEADRSEEGPASEVEMAPIRKVLARLASRGLKEVEALRIDLADSDQLEKHIREEQAQIAYVFNDLKEQESILKLNQMIQVDLLRKRHEERIAQLENYRKFKAAESRVEGMLQEFNSRMELEKAIDEEKLTAHAAPTGSFESLRGKLTLPIQGQILSQFGKAFDPKTRLHIFKKGIDISTRPFDRVRAIYSGKVAYSGDLPNYGRVTIIDHGDHFYSLCAHLGELRLKVGDAVAAGDWVGNSDSVGTPVYFEIRARNIPVNPLQWISN